MKESFPLKIDWTNWYFLSFIIPRNKLLYGKRIVRINARKTKPKNNSFPYIASTINAFLIYVPSLRIYMEYMRPETRLSRSPCIIWWEKYLIKSNGSNLINLFVRHALRLIIRLILFIRSFCVWIDVLCYILYGGDERKEIVACKL